MKTNYPVDNETTMYFESEWTGAKPLSDLIERINEKWPGITLDEVVISSEYRHVRCIGHDLYDPGDYENYIVIERAM